jgi:hypothetical protein
MTAPEHAVILVHATSHAMRVEKLLRDQGLACKLIPVPRHISSDCGVCVRIAHQDVEAALRVVSAAGIKIDSIHAI